MDLKIGFHIIVGILPLSLVVERKNNAVVSGVLGCLHLLLHRSNRTDTPFQIDFPRHDEVCGDWEVQCQSDHQSGDGSSRARPFDTTKYMLDVDMNPSIKSINYLEIQKLYLPVI